MPRDLADVLRDLLAAHRAESVVDLRRVRHLHRTLVRYVSAEPRDHLQGLVEGAVAECISGSEGALLDAIERVSCEHPGDPVDILASKVARDSIFKMFSRALRKTRWMFGEEIPVVDVPEHVRAGRRVRAHYRLVGYGHLRGIPTANRPQVVGEVLTTLARSGLSARRSRASVRGAG